MVFTLRSFGPPACGRQANGASLRMTVVGMVGGVTKRSNAGRRPALPEEEPKTGGQAAAPTGERKRKEECAAGRTTILRERRY
jgi:hypothetical protein